MRNKFLAKCNLQSASTATGPVVNNGIEQKQAVRQPHHHRPSHPLQHGQLFRSGSPMVNGNPPVVEYRSSPVATSTPRDKPRHCRLMAVSATSQLFEATPPASPRSRQHAGYESTSVSTLQRQTNRNGDIGMTGPPVDNCWQNGDRRMTRQNRGTVTSNVFAILCFDQILKTTASYTLVKH